VQNAINAFAEGKHPLHLGRVRPELSLPLSRVWRGRYQEKDGSFSLRTHSADNGGLKDDDAAAVASSAAGFCGAVASMQHLQESGVDGSPAMHRESTRTSSAGLGDNGGSASAPSPRPPSEPVPPPLLMQSEDTMLNELQGAGGKLPRVSAVQVPHAPLPPAPHRLRAFCSRLFVDAACSRLCVWLAG